MATDPQADIAAAMSGAEPQAPAGGQAPLDPPTTGGQPSSIGLLGQLIRFALIGGFCALIDLGTYTLLTQVAGMAASPWVDIARAISFIVGTTTAFFLNRKFTFSGGRRDGKTQVGSFVLLYTVTFFVAVGVNQLMLQVLPESAWQHTLCWAVSQATATVINFVMLKWVVFREPSTEEN